jgi:hypothetical protein
MQEMPAAVGGIVTPKSELFAISLLAFALRTWDGWKLYGKLDERKF